MYDNDRSFAGGVPRPSPSLLPRAQTRARADALVAAGRYEEAAPLYRREAARFRGLGDPDAAKALEDRADRYAARLALFVERPDLDPPMRPSLARHEPAYGCYVGGFIDRDERLGPGFVANGQRHRDPAAFGHATGKKHATTFCYLSWGRPFPSAWVRRLKWQGVAPHIAWEPNRGLDEVRHDEYLLRFAREAARSGAHVFLRYASEMNGDWTRYGGDPGEYVRKWRLVQDVFRREAPNVALIWCVNHVPEKRIEAFYPGDDYVDWVGVNFYSVPFYNDDRSRPGFADHPADRLKFVYQTYAARKPVAVCEYGASHRARVDDQDRSGWAASKIAELYAALPRAYPRVKMVNVFDCDNLTYAQPGRQLNNYSVTDSEAVRRAYADAVRPDYFLEEVNGPARPTPILPLGATARLRRGTVRVSALARSYGARRVVRYLLNGKPAAAVDAPGPREAVLRLDRPGAYRLTAELKDDRGRVVARAASAITVA